MPTRAQALELFNAKWPNVEAVIAFHAGKLRLRHQIIDELLQLAALRLWRACLSAGGDPGRINAQMVGLNAYQDFARQGRRDNRRLAGRTVTSLDRQDRDKSNREDRAIDPPARAVEIHVDGVTLSLADARMDAPELCELAESGISRGEAARILEIGPERVRQLGRTMKGRKLRGIGWRFQRETVEAEAHRRQETRDRAKDRLSGTEAAQLLNVSTETVRLMAATLEGEYMPGIGWRFPRQAVEKEAQRRRLATLIPP